MRTEKNESIDCLIWIKQSIERLKWKPGRKRNIVTKDYNPIQSITNNVCKWVNEQNLHWKKKNNWSNVRNATKLSRKFRSQKSDETSYEKIFGILALHFWKIESYV